MSRHMITLTVRYLMDEMDGTPEASAEIAENLIAETLGREMAGDVTVDVRDCWEVTA